MARTGGEAAAHLARIWTERGDHAAAEPHWRAAAAAGVAGALLGLGGALLAQGKAAQAEACFVGAADAASMVMRAHAQALAGRDAEAIRTLDAALKVDPRSEAARFYLAEALVRTGDLKRADLQLHYVLRLRPGYAPALALRGEIARRNGLFRQAVGDLLRAHELQPGDSAVLVRLGEAYAGLGEPAQALRAFDLAIEADPPCWGAYAAAARTLEAAGGAYEARAYFRALATAPDAGLREAAEAGIARVEALLASLGLPAARMPGFARMRRAAAFTAPEAPPPAVRPAAGTGGGAIRPGTAPLRPFAGLPGRGGTAPLELPPEALPAGPGTPVSGAPLPPGAFGPTSPGFAPHAAPGQPPPGPTPPGPAAPGQPASGQPASGQPAGAHGHAGLPGAAPGPGAGIGMGPATGIATGVTPGPQVDAAQPPDRAIPGAPPVPGRPGAPTGRPRGTAPLAMPEAPPGAPGVPQRPAGPAPLTMPGRPGTARLPGADRPAPRGTGPLPSPDLAFPDEPPPDRPAG